MTAILLTLNLCSYLVRYVLYVRPDDMDTLQSMPRVLKWVRQGMLKLVLWDAIKIPRGLPQWLDQRAVYNHAGKGCGYWGVLDPFFTSQASYRPLT